MTFQYRVFETSKAALFIITMGAVLLFPTIGRSQVTFEAFVDSFRKEGQPFLYSECSVKMGKALLVITLRHERYDIWLFEIEGGWLKLGTQIEPKGNTFVLNNPPGGEETRAILRDHVNQLLKGSFQFLFAKEADRLRSVPKARCAE
jgi:hypothetical protein